MTALTTVEIGDYALTLERADNSNSSNNLVVIEQEFAVAKIPIRFFAMIGDFSMPELTANHCVQNSGFDDDEFELIAHNFTENRPVRNLLCG